MDWGIIRCTWLFFLVLTGPLVFPGNGFADSEPHQEGLYLRFSGGAGSSTSSLKIPDQRLEISGRSINFNLAAGWVVSPNLILHGTFLGWRADKPTQDMPGKSMDSEIDQMSLTGIAGGATYYFMPANIFLSGCLGTGKLTYQPDTSGLGETETGNGLIYEVLLGKEWLVGRNLGLGLALVFDYHSMPDNGSEESWTGLTSAVRLTASWN
jgi:hypothetical protein